MITKEEMKLLPLKTTVANVNHYILRQFGLEDFCVSSQSCRLFFGEAQGQEVKMCFTSARPTLKPFRNTLEHLSKSLQTLKPQTKTVLSLFLKETPKFLGSDLSSSMFHMFHCSQCQGHGGPPAEVMWPTLLEYGGAQGSNHRGTDSVAEPAHR